MSSRAVLEQKPVVIGGPFFVCSSMLVVKFISEFDSSPPSVPTRSIATPMQEGHGEVNEVSAS